MNNFQLQPGQKVSCVLYDGNSFIEANMTYNWLEDARKKEKPVPLGKTKLFIILSNVEIIENSKPLEIEQHYQVKLEGKII
jgi:inner membrane protein involved in colicin E2 resistance